MKYIVALVALAVVVGLLAVTCGEREKPKDADQKLRDAQAAWNIERARNAEKAIVDRQANDSLKMLLARKPTVIVRHDTALVPVAEWRFITDTLRPKCEQCAARVDSLLARHAREDSAAQNVSRLERDANVRLRQSISRQRLKDRVGVFVGYGAQKDGTDVKVGWQVGIGLRAWP